MTSDSDEVLAYFSVMAPNFLSAADAVIVSKHVARNALLSIGRTFVIITGAIDPSVGSIVGHCAMVAGWLVLNGVDTWLGYTIWVNSVEIVAITLAVGIGVGLIMSGVSSFWQTVIKGVGIVLAFVIGPAKSRLQARVAHAQEAAVRR
ncbi:MAG: hypothetical protein ACK47C_06755 [Paracoccaceae bacterium]